jgi:hypothetical protein
VPNGTIYSTNSTIELLHGGVGGAELQKRERSSFKHPIVFVHITVLGTPSRAIQSEDRIPYVAFPAFFL